MDILSMLVVLVVLVVVIGLVLPASTQVSRSVDIAAPPALVFGYVNNFRKFNEWSPWLRRDPEAKHEFTGPENGTGSKMSWQSEHKQVGSGSQEILESEPDRFVKVFLDFGAKGQCEATYTLTATETGTHILWGFDAQHGWNIMARYFGLMMDRMVGPDFEAGLANLKEVAEAAVPDQGVQL